MAFTTKKYTRPVLLTELRRVNVNNFNSLSSLARALSPRAGLRSAKVAALRSVVNETGLTLSTVFSGNVSPSFAKKTLLNLVRNS